MSRTYDEAALALGLTKRWLQDHIDVLPHHRYGRHVRFTDADIAAIEAKHQMSATTPAPHLTVLRARAATRRRAA